MGVLNEQTTGNIHYATNFVSAVKSRDVSQITNVLAEKNVINQTTAKQIQSANSFAKAVKTGNVNQIASNLLDNNFIDASTAAKVKTAHNFATAIKTGDVNQFTESLYQNNFINKSTASKITAANDFATAIKTGNVKQIASSLSQNNVINKNMADNVTNLSDYYSYAKQHASSIEQMIRTKNFDLQAANDAYQFMKTGTGSTVVNRSQNYASQGYSSQSTGGFNPSASTPGFIPSYYANSLAGDDAAYKKGASNTETDDDKNYTDSVRVKPEGGLEITLTYNSEPPKPRNSYQKAIITGADVITDFTPGVSNIKDGTIALTGINPVTGEKVGTGGRILSGFFALPVVGNIGKYIAKGGALIYKGVKSVSKSAEVTAGIAKASRRTNISFRTAEDVNSKYPSGWEPPYKLGTRVTEFTTTTKEIYIRFHGESNKARSWMMKRESVHNMTPQQIQSKYALPELPTLMSEVHVPVGTRIRTGKVNPVFGGAGGATQYELLQRLPESVFKNTVSVD